MPDCAHSTRLPTIQAQKVLLSIAAELRRLDEHLHALAATIRRSSGRLLPDELRGVIQCVRTDLLQDAIETLEAVGRQTEEDLLRERIRLRDLLEQLREAG